MTDLPSHLTAIQEFFDAMNDLMRGSEPAPVRKQTCRGCGGTGDMPSGRACTWCALGDQWDGKIDGSDD